jgi:hypothetical protein
LFLFVIPQRSRGPRRAVFARWGGAVEESASRSNLHAVTPRP